MVHPCNCSVLVQLLCVLSKFIIKTKFIYLFNHWSSDKKIPTNEKTAVNTHYKWKQLKPCKNKKRYSIYKHKKTHIIHKVIEVEVLCNFLSKLTSTSKPRERIACDRMRWCIISQGSDPFGVGEEDKGFLAYTWFFLWNSRDRTACIVS